MTWLIAIRRNLAIDRIRSRPASAMAGEGRDRLDRIPDSRGTGEGRLIAKDEGRRIADCFATLEPDRAQSVRGASLDGLSCNHLAYRYGVPLNTMRTWLRRSLLILREGLDR